MDQHSVSDTTMGRLLGDWLHETATELPDDPALLGRIKAARATARPRLGRSLPRRSMRLVAASAVAVSVVVVTGLALRTPPETWFGAGAATASPSPSPMPLPEGLIPPGRYAFAPDMVSITKPYQVSLDIPSGWRNDNGGWVLTLKDGDPPAGATVEVEPLITWILVDPCGPAEVKVEVPPGSSLESVAGILAAWGADTGARSPSSPRTTEPVFGTFSGRPGVELTVLTPADVSPDACLDGEYRLWGDAIGSRWIQGAGESMRLRLVEVGTELLYLAAGSFAGTPAEILAEQQAMLDSVRIVPLATDASPTPAGSDAAG